MRHLISMFTLIGLSATLWAAETVGVKECDQFIAKYQACIDSKVASDQKPAMQANLDAMASAWKAQARTGAGKKAMSIACVQADAENRPAMEAYQCNW